MPTQWDPEKGFAIGDNVAFRIGGTLRHYHIINRDTIFYIDDHDSLAADSTETYDEISDLNPPHGQLYAIYKICIDGNVKLYIKQPAATNRWGTQRSPQGGFLTDRTSGLLCGQHTNLYFTIDNPPSVQLVNFTNVAIIPKLYWFGWRYQIEEISEPSEYTIITIGGLAE